MKEIIDIDIVKSILSDTIEEEAYAISVADQNRVGIAENVSVLASISIAVSLKRIANAIEKIEEQFNEHL